MQAVHNAVMQQGLFFHIVNHNEMLPLTLSCHNIWLFGRFFHLAIFSSWNVIFNNYAANNNNVSINAKKEKMKKKWNAILKLKRNYE